MGAALLRAEGKLREAESEYLLGLNAARAAGLGESPDGASVLTGLGGLYIEQNRFGDALRAFDLAAQILMPRKDSHPMEYMELLLGKALLCTKQAYWQDAERDLNEYLDIAKRSPPDAGLMASVLTWYAVVLRKIHRGREAHSFEAQASSLRGLSQSNAIVDVTELAHAARRKAH